LQLLAPRLVLDAVRLQIVEEAWNSNDFQAMGITGRANLERRKSTQLGRARNPASNVSYGAILRIR
jgi:hypothetical protein